VIAWTALLSGVKRSATFSAATGEPLPAQSSAFVLGRPAPDAVFLIGLDGELQTDALDSTGPAHGFGRLNLVDGIAGAAGREEQVRVREATTRSTRQAVPAAVEGEAPSLSLIVTRPPPLNVVNR